MMTQSTRAYIYIYIHVYGPYIWSIYIHIIYIYRKRYRDIDMETIHRTHHVSNKPCVNYMVPALPDRRNVTSLRRCPIHMAYSWALGLSKTRLNRRVYTEILQIITTYKGFIIGEYNDALGIVYMLYYKLTALNSPVYLKIRTKTNPIQTADRQTDECDTPKPPEAC